MTNSSSNGITLEKLIENLDKITPEQDKLFASVYEKGIPGFITHAKKEFSTNPQKINEFLLNINKEYQKIELLKTRAPLTAAQFKQFMDSLSAIIRHKPPLDQHKSYQGDISFIIIIMTIIGIIFGTILFIKYKK